MAKKAQFIILGEDKQHTTFVRRLLISLGYSYHKIRTRPVAVGQQAGDQYVRERYPIEVKSYRSRAARMEVNLIVMIDADTKSVDQRKAELATTLAAASIFPLAPSEKIAILVPKRNIETWIYALDHVLAEKKSVSNIDEQTSYPKLRGESKCQGAVDGLVQILHSTQSSNTGDEQHLPSLRDAIVTLRNVLPR